MQGGGGGGWEGGCHHKSRHILYTRHTVMTSSTESYSLMKIFLTIFKTEGIVALTIKGSLLRKYNKNCQKTMEHALWELAFKMGILV